MFLPYCQPSCSRSLHSSSCTITEVRQAAELGRNDPRTHLALGLALACGGQKGEARSELEKAAELAKADVRFRNAEVGARQELARNRILRPVRPKVDFVTRHFVSKSLWIMHNENQRGFCQSEVSFVLSVPFPF